MEDDEHEHKLDEELERRSELRFCWSYADYQNEFKCCALCGDYSNENMVHNFNVDELVGKCTDPICTHLLWNGAQYSWKIKSMCVFCFKKYFKIIYKFPWVEPYEFSSSYRLCVIRHEPIKPCLS